MLFFAFPVGYCRQDCANHPKVATFMVALERYFWAGRFDSPEEFHNLRSDPENTCGSFLKIISFG